MTAPRTLEEAELGPEPPTGDFPFWQIWVAKCGIVRFRHQRDAVEAMALVQMVKLLVSLSTERYVLSAFSDHGI
jgi:hypothetical protein